MKGSSLNISQPRAVVVGLDSMQGLQAARILAARRVPVIGVTNRPNYYACRTKVCEKILFTDTGGEGLIATLIAVGQRWREKAVLFPCHDKSVLVISEHRAKLEPWYHVILPDHDVVELMTDKVRFYKHAQKHGFPIPKTFLLYSRQDAEQAAPKLSYPCALKPPWRPHRWTMHTKQKAFKIANPRELLAYYDHYHHWTDVLIAQDWIEGPESNLYSCNGYFDHSGKPVATFVARKLRQWPPLTGQSCLGEECRNDKVLEETIRLFQSVKYRGLAYLEMKRDERSGEHFIVEPNVGRPTGRSAIAEAGGVDLLYSMYCDALGWPLPPKRQQTYQGVKWIHLLRDLQAAFHQWKNGDLRLIDWWRSIRGRKAYAIFSWKDPAPFWWALRSSIPVLLSPRERGSEDIQPETVPGQLRAEQV